MQHTAKDGSPKIRDACTIPLTGAGVVTQIITELAAFNVDKAAGELELTDLAEGVTLEEVKAKTGCAFRVRDNLGSF